MAIYRFVRIAGFALPLAVWWWTIDRSFGQPVSPFIAVAGVLVGLPVVWIGRKLLDAQPTVERTVWVTTVVHYVLMILLGAAVIEATQLAQARPGWLIPLPAELGLVLMVVAGIVLLLTVMNLALRGLGAPFAIALSRRLAAGGLYAWTRNPMVLGGLVFLVAVGLWLRSLWFVLWAVGLVASAVLVFLKVYEERELEIRFGAPYLEYKAKTPMLWPRRPRA